MKRQAFSLISLLSLLLVAGSAIAQTVHVSANIPFNFGVGSKTFPAGTYDVRPIDHHDNKILLLKARDGHASMMVLSNVAENLKPADKTKLVFNQYRNQYFLSEIWVNGWLGIWHRISRAGGSRLWPACSRDGRQHRRKGAHKWITCPFFGLIWYTMSIYSSSRSGSS